jgi:hypothetical protein
MDTTNIRFDKSSKDLLENIQILSNHFNTSDTNKNNINNLFKLIESSNKLLYSYVGVMCKKIRDYLNENKKTVLLHDDHSIDFNPNIKDFDTKQFEKWDKMLLITDEINGFVNLSIQFDNNVSLAFVNEFLNFVNTISKSTDIYLFYYVITTRNINFTNIDDLKNIINASISEFEDDIYINCNTKFSLEEKFNIINYYYEIFFINSKSDNLLYKIWGTEDEYNTKKKETKKLPDNFDIFGKLFNNNTLGKCDFGDLNNAEDGDVGDILKNAMMNMFSGLGGLGGLGGLDKINKEEDSDGDLDEDPDPDVQAIEKLIDNISDNGHFSNKNDDHIDDID